MKGIKVIASLVQLALLAGCRTIPGDKEQDLIFLGTIEKIEISPLEQSTQNWVVHCRVERVLSGTFPGKTFAFRIHSPAMSGLEKGKTYKVETKLTPDGYTVDQNQWMTRTLNKAVEATSQ